MHILSKHCWIFGDNIDTDQILPGHAMTEAENRLAAFAMAGSSVPDFARRVKSGDIIVAGVNFGCGSSREQAPFALQRAGVSVIIAASFARIFRRNAINIGLPVIEADIWRELKEGSPLCVDLSAATIHCAQSVFQARPLSPSALATLQAGGLINRVRLELGVLNPERRRTDA